MDLFGPNAYISIGGNKYDFVIVDDFSHFTWVFFLKDKSETQGIFKKFARRAQNEIEVKIKKVRSDNGTEFRNTNIEAFLDEEGIKHEFSVPQQKGVVERKNRTLIEAEEQCWMSTRFRRKIIGRKLSARHVMPSTACTSTR
jgi:transposase InsO family protein